MNIKKIMQEITDNGGVSFRPETDVRPTSGYVVSVSGFNEKVDEDTFSEKVLEDYIGRVGRIVNDIPSLYIGVWNHSGRVFMDLSANYTDLESAIRAGLVGNQMAIYDVIRNRDINLPIWNGTDRLDTVVQRAVNNAAPQPEV